MVVVTALAIGGAGVFAHQRPPLLAGVDHVPVAVRDLERAADTYRRLGFVLKPGTPHANGIRNLHAKFADGTEIELITAPKPADKLTREYVDHLKQGEGPAFLALYTPAGRALAEAVPDDHPARRYIFFGALNRSPTDRAEHFQHPNTAESLSSVWLAADEFKHELDLLARGGVAAPMTRAVRAPQESRVPVVRLGGSSLVLLPSSRQIVPGRRIAGATVRVRNLEAALKVLQASGLNPQVVTAADGRSVFLAPNLACGWWLELTERQTP